MIKAYKYRLLPNKEHIQYLAQTFGCARLLYNQLLNWWINEYALSKQNDKPMGKLPLVSHFKTQFTFLKNVDSLALMNARRNFEVAIGNFIKSKQGKRKGKKVGFPRFKKKGASRDSFTTNNVNDAIRVYGDKIKLPKVGYIPFIKHRPLPNNSRIVSVNVSKTPSEQYYISIVVELPDTNVVYKHTDNPNVVGLDMSLSHFIVDSDNTPDNTKTKYVKQYRKNERKLKRLQRILSRRELIPTGEMVYSKKYNKDIPKTERSKNREKARIKLAKLHQHVSNCRRDFSIKQAIHYARMYDVIVIEDINLQDMKRTLKLGKSVNDLGFGIFKQWLQYKCDEYGALLVKADKWYPSSKLCNHCGNKNSLLLLSDRVWVCPECGSVIDRDYNAACNLKDYYYNMSNNTVGTTGINAYGDTTSTLGNITPIASCVNEVGSTLF